METVIAVAIGVLIAFGAILVGMTVFLTADWWRSDH